VKYKRAGILPILALLLVTSVALGPALFSSECLQTGDGRLSSLARVKEGYPASHGGSWHPGALGQASVPTPISPRRAALLILPPKNYKKAAYLIDLTLLGLAMYFWLRSKRHSEGVALCAAVALAMQGHSFTIINAGHMGKYGMFPFLVGTLALLEWAIRRRKLTGFALAGLCLAIAFGEQADVTILASLFVAAFAAFLIVSPGASIRQSTKVLKPALGLVLAGSVFALVSLPSLVGHFSTKVQASSAVPTQAHEQTSPETKWDTATQWSFPPEDSLEFIAPAVRGLHSQHRTKPYWGRQGRSPNWANTGQGFRNFRQEGQYAGVVVVVLALCAAGILFLPKRLNIAPVKKTEVGFWFTILVLSYLLALGKYAPLYRLIYSLPYFGTIRNPVKFLYITEIAATILFAYTLSVFARLRATQRSATTTHLGVETFIRRQLRRLKQQPQIAVEWAMWFGVSLLLSGAAVVQFTGAHREALLRTEGWGEVAATLVDSMSAALLRSGIVLAIAASLFLLDRCTRLFRSRAWLFTAALLSLIMVDMLSVNWHYVTTYDERPVYSKNLLTETLEREAQPFRLKILGQNQVYGYWSQTLFPYHGIQNVDAHPGR